MRNRRIPLVMAALILILIPSATLAIEPYYQSFEELDQSSPSALADDGWLVYGNVFTPDSTYIYGYGPFPAPNHSLAFCQIALGEGGEEQGEQVLSVFSDYENLDHGNGNLIESNVYHEQLIVADDIGGIWRFAFQHKRGNIEGQATAQAFIKTLDPAQGYLTTNLITVDMTSIPDSWAADTLLIVIDETLENQLLQFGFSNIATNYEGSGIFYDNLAFDWIGTVDVPEARHIPLATLHQNAPNPFGRTTHIGFSLERPGHATLSVLDLAGRHVVTLANGDHMAGNHHVSWNGRTAQGSPAPSGTYWYVLRTESEEMSGRMILTD